eukprot:TRINITY_DN9802_c0_g1_i2.p2 TRINITY_DN9802_c0_g1~~TRINITY_DN9802_c0_g1_i2.p2  ORF type:complete len:109 (+),score=21.02 TRINITY_DN9802_c0_g1_i2:251-577(+)
MNQRSPVLAIEEQDHYGPAKEILSLTSGCRDCQGAVVGDVSLLSTAACIGHASLVACLLDAGADLEQRDDEHRRTALHWAFKCQLQTDHALLLRGAAFAPKTSTGCAY